MEITIAELTSYRPICLLNTTGKVVERIIYNGLYLILDSGCYLSDAYLNFDFWKARPAVDATKVVIELVRTAFEGKYCALVIPDIKNVLNSSRWNRIITTSRARL